MNQFSFLTCALRVGLVLALSANVSLAADKADYSGKYSLQNQKTSAGNETDTILEVAQHEDSIEITRVAKGKRTTSRCPLNGSDGDYTSPGGVSGKCKAQLKNKYLALESVVVSQPQPSAPPVRLHTKERWQLSPDAKTLTIKSNTDFPDFPSDISAAVAADTAGTEKYTRIEGP